MRRDGEDELDPADIGGEGDATTHVLNIAAPENAPTRWTGSSGPSMAQCEEAMRNARCRATRAK
jgi:hypothetical protein